MEYLKDKDYNIKYITTDGKTKEVNIKPEQNMNKPQMINKLKSENKDFFKLVESKNLKENLSDSDLYFEEEFDEMNENKELLVEDNESIKDKLSKIIEKDAQENDYYNIDKEEWDNFSFEEKFYEWEKRNYLDDYFDELGIETYEDSLQLSDTPVMNFINNEYFDEMNPDEAMSWYWHQVDAFLTSFEEEMQNKGLLQGEVYYEGRSSRHIVIEDTLDNVLNYDKIKQAYEKLEQEFIEYMNNVNPYEEE